MSEPDYPYPKNPPQPTESSIDAPPPMPPEPPSPQPPPTLNPAPTRFICSACGKSFTTKAELTMHMQTVHQIPKK